MDQHLLFRVLVIAVLVAAVLLQLAVIKASDIPSDCRAKLAARKVTILAMGIGIVAIADTILNDRSANPVFVLAMGLVGMAQCVNAMVRLFPGGIHHE